MTHLNMPKTAWLAGVVGAVGLAIGLSACDTTGVTPITAAICTDLTAVQSSGLALNSNEQLALKGLISSCAATQGGTVFSNTTIVAAMINDAILLQSSGLLSDIHLTAEVPASQAEALKHLRVDTAHLKAALSK